MVLAFESKLGCPHGWWQLKQLQLFNNHNSNKRSEPSSAAEIKKRFFCLCKQTLT
jgi:hypothetical protein